MSITRRLILKTAGAVTALALGASGAMANDPLRVGLGDIASVESLNLLIASGATTSPLTPRK